MPIHVPDLGVRQIIAAAEKCLRDCSPARIIPVDIETIIDNAYRIDIVPEYGLLRNFNAVMYITRDLQEIRVDEHVFHNELHRYRISLAHELAHHVLHADVYGNLSFKTTEEWRYAMESISDDEYDTMEWQASMFARMLLVPGPELRQRFNSWQTKMRLAGIDLRDASPVACDRIIRALSGEFDVGRGSILGRVKSEDLWPGIWPFDPPVEPRPDKP